MHPETILSGERWGSAQAAPCPRRGPRAVKLDLVEAAVVKQEVHAFPRSGWGWASLWPRRLQPQRFRSCLSPWPASKGLTSELQFAICKMTAFVLGPAECP